MRIPKIDNDRMRRHRARGISDQQVIRVNHFDERLVEDPSYWQQQFESWRQAMIIKHGKRPNATFQFVAEADFDIDRNEHVMRMWVHKIPHTISRPA